MTFQHKQNISNALKGRKFSPEHCNNIAFVKQGVIISEKQKKQISDTLKRKGIRPPSRKGIINPNALRYQPGIRAFYHHRSEARRTNNGGSHTFEEWGDLKKKYNYTCPCCGKKEPEIKLTEDHIIPISKGGHNSIDNIQPLCFSCNSKKHTKVKRYGETR